jgi:protein ImuB
MFVSLHIPDFAMAAALSGRPEEADTPCAILAAGSGKIPKDKLPLRAVNQAARHTGIGAGWPLNRSLVRCPSLKVILADPAAEASLRDGLVRLGESLTPDLELTAVDAVTLDLSHRRSPADRLPEGLSLRDVDLWIGLGSTPDLAHLAARHRELHGRMIAPADLASLPLERLAIFSPEVGTLTILGWWGIKTLGDFMNLPRQALAERLGPEAGHWHDVLHGKSCRLLRLHRPPESLAQRLELEDAVSTLDPVIFSLKRLLHTLAARLASRALAAGVLDLKLVLESGEEISRRVRLPDPQTAVEGMLSPLQTWLDSLRIDAAVVALELNAEATFRGASQRDWLRRELPQPARWAETLAKLEALLGPGRVGIPVPADSHAPDVFTLRPGAGHPGLISSRADRPACPVPLQRYRPARPVAVAHEWTNGRPVPLALLTGPHPGEIIGCRGPFPASGTWWQSSEAWQRLEWDIQIASRHLLRLVFETPDRWQLEGIYR